MGDICWSPWIFLKGCVKICCLCAYADDFLLGLVGTKAEAVEIKQKLAAFLRSHLKLELSDEKTLVTHARDEVARFLGYEIHILH